MILKTLPPVANESNRDYSYRVLKESILEMYLEPGSELSEITVSKKLQLSRTPIREAFLILEQEGLIFVTPKVGTFVSKISVEHIDNAIFIRETIEKEILKRVCDKKDPKLIAELKENIKAQELLLNLNSIDSFYMLDNAFHEIIYENVGQKFSWTMIQSTNYSLNRARKLEVSEIHTAPELIDEHKELVNIIETRNYDAIPMFLEKHLYKIFHAAPKIKEMYPAFFK